GRDLEAHRAHAAEKPGDDEDGRRAAVRLDAERTGEDDGAGEVDDGVGAEADEHPDAPRDDAGAHVLGVGLVLGGHGLTDALGRSVVSAWTSQRGTNVSTIAMGIVVVIMPQLVILNNAAR